MFKEQYRVKDPYQQRLLHYENLQTQFQCGHSIIFSQFMHKEALIMWFNVIWLSQASPFHIVVSLLHDFFNRHHFILGYGLKLLA